MIPLYSIGKVAMATDANANWLRVARWQLKSNKIFVQKPEPGRPYFHNFQGLQMGSHKTHQSFNILVVPFTYSICKFVLTEIELN